jgi:ribosomal protein S18 acetylase RimI-like enzyme
VTRSTDLADAAATLAAAFAGGPAVTHVQPDLARQRRTLPAMFAPVLRLCDRSGGVDLVGGTAGVCAWIPSPQLRIGPLAVLRSGLWRLPLPGRFGPAATLRLLRHEHATDAALVRHAGPRVAYLWLLGADPQRQGEGLGRAALEAGLASMRAAGFDRCLLKTETPQNVALYTHLGFAQVDEVTPRSSGVPAWSFLRGL